jgi:glycine cleavage system H protein
MANPKEVMNFMGHLWIRIEGDEVTVGINEDSLEEVGEIDAVVLPEQGENFEADDVCGEVETADGPINLYTPVTGSVTEINNDVLDDPDLILQDPYGDGWLFKIEADSPEEISQLSSGDYDH